MKLLPKQKEFCFDIKTPQLAYLGGYGSGKTYAACIKALLLSGYNAGTAGMLVSPTFPMLRDTTRRTFLEILETNEIGFNFKATENKIILNEVNSEVWFRSADDPTRLKGSNLAWIGLDEPALMHEEAYNVSLSRLRDPKAGAIQLFFTGTHEGFSWLYDKIDNNQSDKIKVIRGSTNENSFLPSMYVESLYDNYDEEQIKQYVNGYATLINKGRVYYSFHREFNLHDKDYNPNLPIVLAVDFNINPLCWSIIQNYGTQDFVIDEIILHNSNTEAASNEVRRRYPNADIYIYGDYSGTFRHTSSPTTDYEIMKSIIYPAAVNIKPDPPVINRVNSVNARFKNAKGERRLFVHSKCKHTIRDFEQVSYKEGKREIDKTNLDLTHISDAIGYYIEYEYSLKGKPIVKQF
ncbi:MAG: phage terminase large subunit [Thermoplasmata archaeon]